MRGRRTDGQPRVSHERAQRPCDASVARAACRGSLSAAQMSLSRTALSGADGSLSLPNSLRQHIARSRLGVFDILAAALR
jgi:hypothetical protein